MCPRTTSGRLRATGERAPHPGPLRSTCSVASSADVDVSPRVALALGYGDGLNAPCDDEHALSPSDEVLVAHVGGPRRLAERINWYRGALSQ